MKKIGIGIINLFLLTGITSAHDDVIMVDQGAIYSKGMTEATLEIALSSAYVDRGQVMNNDPVIQPEITLSQYGFSVNMWANYDLGSNMHSVSSDVSEFDLSFAYSLPVDINQMAIDIGIINYNFPGNGNASLPSTTELFLSSTILSFEDLFVPSITIFGDIEEYPGAYVLLDVVIPYEVSEFMSVAGGISAGYGNTSYNDENWASGSGSYDADYNDFNLYVTGNYEVSDTLTAAAHLTYTTLNGSSFERAAKAAGYEASKKLWGGVKIAYDF